MTEQDRSAVLFDAQVRLAIYDGFIERGQAPAARELAAILGCSEHDVQAALERLHEAHKLVLQAGGSEVLMAHPFSAVPTAFEVQVADRRWWANCIWDALGIPAMLKQDATIVTSCACCGDAMTVSVRDGKLVAADGVIHFAVPARRWWDSIVFT